MSDPTAQLIIFLDKSGNFHAELPGLNGARVKVYLGENFRERNPEITTALLDKQAENARQRARIDEEIAARHNAKSQGEKLAELNAERAARFDAWLETLPRDRREIEIAKKQKRDEKAATYLAERAKDIWHNTANHHGVNLANRVIPDANRRPAKKVVIYTQDGTRKEISPRTGTTTVNNKKIDPTLILDL